VVPLIPRFFLDYPSQQQLTDFRLSARRRE